MQKESPSLQGGEDVKSIPIGRIEHGIDGHDDYLLLKRLDDDLTPEQARAWLLPQVYADTSRPGGAFCHTIRAVQVEHSTNEVICTVQHRYDI